jgi:ABC-type enterochelin transport system substrate-binding protein
MTLIERVKVALDNADYEKDTIDKLINFAYFMGRETAVKELADKYTALIDEQRARAVQCRYSNMAMKVIGDKRFIYASDYRQDMTGLFGSDETAI